MHIPIFVQHEAILQKEASKPGDLDALLLRFRSRPQAIVEYGPELLSELNMVGKVIPTVLVHLPDPEHSLEPPQRHAKGIDLGVPPVADTHDGARVGIHVNIVLEEVGVVWHQGPVLITDTRELGDQGV